MEHVTPLQPSTAEPRVGVGESPGLMAPAHDRQQRAAAYRACVERFDQWIADNMLDGDEGWRTPTSADGYFSVAAYASHAGRTDWAIRALNHVERHFIESDGSLRQNANRDQMITYVPSWFAWAAQRAEVFRVSGPLLDSIIGFQDPRSGGFFAGREERRHQNGAIDFDSTTMSVIALAQGGRVQAAAKGADYLLRLCRAQPDPAQQFCTAWSEPQGVQTQPGQVAPTTILRFDQPKQHYYKAGLFVLALGHVYGITGKREYLGTAASLYNETITRAVDLWTNTLSHKMCWAATTLYAITGEPDYLSHACRFADHLVGLQQPDGAFTYPEFFPSYPPERWEPLPNVGSQFALWVLRALRALESTAAGAPAREHTAQ